MNSLPVNRVVCADVHRLLSSLPDACVDLAVLDPGYGLRKGSWDFEPDYDATFLREVRRVLKDSGTAYVFGPLAAIAQNWASFPAPKRILTWAVTNRVVPSCKSWQPVSEGIVMLCKSSAPYFNRDAVREEYSDGFKRQRGRRRSPTPGRFGAQESRFSMAAGALPRDVLRGPGLSGRVGARESLGHSCQKPLWLAERLIKASSPPGGLVLDLFAGTSTVSVAAHRLGRRWISVEQDDGWCQVSLKRLRGAGAEAEVIVPPGPAALEDLLDWKEQAAVELATLKDAVTMLTTAPGQAM